MRFMAMLAVVCGVLQLVGSAGAQFSPRQQAIAQFDAEVARGVAEDAGGCVVVGVFCGDEMIWARAYGWADIATDRPARRDTIIRIGSISKSMTAVLAMQMAERGLLHLDDPVRTVLPELDQLAERPEESIPVTFRMLASHTSGLAREPWLRDAASGSIYRWEEKVLESIPLTHFRSAPMTEYSYSNIGYGILGLAVARAADRPFIELVHDQIFLPLGMDDTTFVVNDPDRLGRLAVGYRWRRDGELTDEPATVEHWGRGYKVPNGGVYSTVDDLAKFAAAMMGASEVQILSDESRQQMLAPAPPAESYGLGFSIQADGERTVVGHGGSVAGYNADLRFETRSGLGVVTLRTTRYQPPSGDLLNALLNLDEGRQH